MPMTPQQMHDMYQQEMGAPGAPPANMMVPPQAGPPATLSLQDMMALHQQGKVVPQGQLAPDLGMPQGFAQVPQPGQVPTATGQPSVVPNPDGSMGSMAMAASVSGVPAVSPITGQAPGAATFNAAQRQFNSATDEGQLANAAYLGAAGDEQQALVDEGAAQLDINQVAADKGQAMAGIDAERETQASAYETKRKEMMAKFDKENAIQERRMQMAVEEAGNTQIHDFWADKTTGARILGVIAQALSGAANGLAGNPGAPTPLDRLINDDLQKQMANQQNKRGVAQQQMGVYQSMLTATGNRLDAEVATQQAANNRIAAMVTTLSDKMAVPEAAARGKQINAQLEQRNAQLGEQRAVTQQGIAAQKVNYALNQMGDAEKLGVYAGAASAKADAAANKGAEEWSPLPGMLKGVPKAKQTSANYNRTAKESEAITGYLRLMSDAERALNEGGMQAYYDYVAMNGVAFNQMRVATGSGANLNAKEDSINSSFAPGWLKTHIGGNVLSAREMIHANQDAWAGQLLSKYASLNPGGGIDVNTPDIGPILARVIRKRSAGAAHAQPTK